MCCRIPPHRHAKTQCRPRLLTGIKRFQSSTQHAVGFTHRVMARRAPTGHPKADSTHLSCADRIGHHADRYAVRKVPWGQGAEGGPRRVQRRPPCRCARPRSELRQPRCSGLSTGARARVRAGCASRKCAAVGRGSTAGYDSDAGLRALRSGMRLLRQQPAPGQVAAACRVAALSEVAPPASCAACLLEFRSTDAAGFCCETPFVLSKEPGCERLSHCLSYKKFRSAPTVLLLMALVLPSTRCQRLLSCVVCSVTSQAHFGSCPKRVSVYYSTRGKRRRTVQQPRDGSAQAADLKDAAQLALPHLPLPPHLQPSAQSCSLSPENQLCSTYTELEKE